ncbi:dehydrogenase [Actinophytocola xinjiangensis]|uniref:Dehydrogenase n=2 Tax=Actinophytocola xinjiangensis TaxID=485602 RepID=A0A7Z0WR70_9PSEU|nr:YciI family protein [Actinophytocola xinjiangensis]OLF13848.1 dehydrogenase [Actinophytocola xinjiangensis]
MRFMIIRRADEETEAGAQPSEELFEAMSRYNEELLKAGALLDGAGLTPSSLGAAVEWRGGAGPTVVDGPFAEGKELVAGYTMIQADSLQDAIELVKRWPTLDGHGNVELEIRRVGELEDYDISDELKEKERQLRADSEQNRKV